MGSSEYREMVQLLSRLNDEKQLDDFLDKAEKYWGSINVFKLAELERSKGGRGVMATVKGDWPRIWPEALEAERLGAFEQFQRFWGRLERSKLVEDVMKDVLPDMDKGYDDQKASGDWKRLKDMTDEERNKEILGRIGKCELVKQYIILSESDPEVNSVGSKMMPFMARSISLLERKVAAETEELAQSLDQTFLTGGAVLVLLIAGFATGVIPSPLKILGDIWNFTL